MAEELTESWGTLVFLILTPDTAASETVAINLWERETNGANVFVHSWERENWDKKTFGTIQYSYFFDLLFTSTFPWMLFPFWGLHPSVYPSSLPLTFHQGL